VRLPRADLAAEIKLAELRVHVAHHLGRSLAGGGDGFEQEQGIEYAVALGQVAPHADAAGLFGPDQNVFAQHQVGDVLKADGRLVDRQIVCGGDAPEQDGLREGSDHPARLLAAAREVQEDERNDLVHGHGLAVFVNRADPVRVAVGRQPDEGARRFDPRLERREVAVDGLGRDAAEQRVARGADGLDFEQAAGEKAFDPAPARPVHRVDDDAPASAAQQVQLDVAGNLPPVALDEGREVRVFFQRGGAAGRRRVHE
jgi:hypothetical protein